MAFDKFDYHSGAADFPAGVSSTNGGTHFGMFIDWACRRGRMTGRSKHTVLNLLANLGEACQNYHDQHVRGLTTKRVQVDEI